MRGFSLVELSIVLVILGLLTGGILAGQSLIRASELRSVSTEYQRYVAAGQTFRDKYFALPGDLRDATRLWNRQNTGGDCVSNSGIAVAGTPGACDGNGDGSITTAAAANQSGEMFQLWRQLALAGLIEGTYSGTAGTGGGNNTTATNSPKSKFSTAYWQLSTYSASTGNSSIFDRVGTGTAIQFGALDATVGNRNPVFKPEDLWNIDSKMDDGKPATGKVVARTDSVTYVLSDCTTAASSADTAANYLLTRSDVTCSAYFYNPI